MEARRFSSWIYRELVDGALMESWMRWESGVANRKQEAGSMEQESTPKAKSYSLNNHAVTDELMGL